MKQSILNAIPAEVALLDAQGALVGTNRGWDTFCQERDITCHVGDEYLSVFRAFVCGNDAAMRDAAGALNGILREARLEATFQYPCRANDTERWYRARLAPVEGKAERGVIAMHFDVTNTVLAERQLFELAHFDGLTGLPNRALLIDRLNHAIGNAQRHGQKVAVVTADVDHFKDINDSFGSQSGDQFLRELASRLSSCVRKGDSVCRLGGDEFALILTDLNMASDAGLVARKLMEAMRSSFRIADAELYGSVSLGISVFPDDADSAESLLSHADLSMHRAKQQGRSNFHFFTAAMDERAKERVQLDSDLHVAVDKGQFELHYQPKVSCVSGSIVGMEALMRWRHPTRGLVSPGDFIPALEDLRLIAEVGVWAIREACRQFRDWSDAGMDVPSVAVNLSALQFDGDGLVPTIRAALTDFQVPANKLELEMTESLLMRHVDRIVPILAELRALGVQLSVDDFGTGYSSLAYLKLFPLNALKVDRSFIRDITTDPDDASITRAIITMAHHLGLRVVAEGVEMDDQLAFLVASQCDEIQGFFFSRALAPSEMATLLRDDRHLDSGLLQRHHSSRTILVVDDEPSVISSIRRLLHADGYRLLSANNAEDGLALLAKNPVDVVISDQKMLGMSGVDLLRRAKVLYPDTIRISLSGSNDLQGVIDAINEGAIYRFLSKPWDNELLRNTVAEALRQKELTDENHRLANDLLRTNNELIEKNHQLQEMLEVGRPQNSVYSVCGDSRKSVAQVTR